MARPTKLTPDLLEAIVSLVEHAVHPEVAAQAFGVARATLYEWIARGRGTDPMRPMEPIYAEFADAIDAAEAKAESALVALAIAKARTPADAIAVLERRFGARWRDRREVTVNIRQELERLASSPEEAAAALHEVSRILEEARQ